jgi:hypothetical protein
LRFERRSGGFLTKRSGLEGAVEDSGGDLVGLTVMDLIRRHQADASMVTILIVPRLDSLAFGLAG